MEPLLGLLSLANVVTRAVLTAPGPLNLIHAGSSQPDDRHVPFHVYPGVFRPLGGGAARFGYPVDHQPCESGSLPFPSKVENRMRLPLMFLMTSEARIVPYQQSNGPHNISQPVCQPQQAKKVLEENMSISAVLPCQSPFTKKAVKPFWLL